MYGWCQIFIIMAMIYHTCIIVSGTRLIIRDLANENCDCDVLQITEPDGSSSNYTRQNGVINFRPYFFSMKRNLISWNKQKWSYDKYDSKLNKFTTKLKLNEDYFSFENMCNKLTNGIIWKVKNIDITSQCLRHNSNCLATRELSWTRSTGGSKTKRIKLQAKNPCKFPFIYKNVTYNSCTKMNRDEFWCAATVDATNHATSWGYCSDSCPKEEDGISNCDCDVLEINYQDGLIGYQNFTKQNDAYNGKPYYFSSQWNMISWNNNFWSYGTYNSKFKIIETTENDSTIFFSFENICKNGIVKVNGHTVESRCLKRDNSNCSAIKELIRINNGIHVKLQPRNPCKFPFIYKNVEYKSCTKNEYDKFWCATMVNATNHETSSGICNEVCPRILTLPTEDAG